MENHFWHLLFSAAISGTFLLAAAATVAQETASNALLGKDAKIIFFGDSITEMGDEPGGYVWLVRSALKERRPELNISVVGAGISGNKVTDLLRRFKRDVLSQRPTLVVIYIGVNDVHHLLFGQGTSPEQFESGLKTMVAELVKEGMKVMLCTPSVIGENLGAANEFNQILDNYAVISRRVAQGFSLPVCDLRATFKDYLSKNNPKNDESGVLTSDGVHLNQRGNKLVADILLSLLLP